MGFLDCPDCWDTPCNCETGYLGSKNHAYKELQQRLAEVEKDLAIVRDSRDALVVENEKLKQALKVENILEVIDDWQMYWRNQQINREDTMRYRRRALSVDANMRHSLAKRINKALGGGDEKPK